MPKIFTLRTYLFVIRIPFFADLDALEPNYTVTFRGISATPGKSYNFIPRDVTAESVQKSLQKFAKPELP